MVNPPAVGMVGMWTSSHWPGRKVNGCWLLLSCGRSHQLEFEAFVVLLFLSIYIFEVELNLEPNLIFGS